MKNDNATLPLKTEKYISFFGVRSDNHIVGGSGSGVTSGTTIALPDSLSEAGFKLNPKLVKLYANNSSTSEQKTSMFNGIEDSFAIYNDAAIIDLYADFSSVLYSFLRRRPIVYFDVFYYRRAAIFCGGVLSRRRKWRIRFCRCRIRCAISGVLMRARAWRAIYIFIAFRPFFAYNLRRKTYWAAYKTTKIAYNH